MKTLDEIYKSLDAFSKKFGIPVVDAQQGSEIWYLLKLGVISASNISRAVAKKGTETRLTYMAELVGQIATGLMEDINSKYVEWGNDHEDAARASYEFANGCTVQRLPFVFRDGTYREGCSPDGLITGKGIEIKCPYNTVHYIKFLTEDSVKPEYKWQYQHTLRVLDAEEWDFVQFDPRMKKNPMHVVTVKRDPDMQTKMDDLIPEFIEDMDEMLERVGFTFGEQWTRLSGSFKETK